MYITVEGKYIRHVLFIQNYLKYLKNKIHIKSTLNYIIYLTKVTTSMQSQSKLSFITYYNTNFLKGLIIK